MCGEKSSDTPAMPIGLGSPPRVRGKEARFKLRGLCGGRITPACAGKRNRHPWRGCRQKDHPRVCGEKCAAEGVTVHSVGSPPRVRGKENHHFLQLLLLRITPACAGKRAFATLILIAAKDHPRVCGEK